MHLSIPETGLSLFLERWALASLFLTAVVGTVVAQPQSLSRSVFLKARAGLSSYLGDNNTVAFNSQAFRVKDKVPYSFGAELGYQFSPAWSASIGLQVADYPLITRFYDDLSIQDHPTRRRTNQLIFRYQPGNRTLRPYVHFGYHLTFGKVSIFETLVLDSEMHPNVHNHYIHGPLLGAGIEYALTPSLGFFAETTAHATLMDDSVDGRLPLGPPQPTNHREVNRFGTFDLLSAVGIGFIYRPWKDRSCGKACGSSRSTDPTESGASLIRYASAIRGSITSASYHYAFQGLSEVFFGVEGGLAPRQINVKYQFQDGQITLDQIPFTGAFIGISARWFPKKLLKGNAQPHFGAAVFTPFQVHAIAGMDYLIGDHVSMGFEGRFAFCPTRRQQFDMAIAYEGQTEPINYQMTRTCEYSTGLALTMGYRSR